MLIAGEGIPPQATWIRRDAFFAVGGFDPLTVPAEDADLVRRIGLFGPIAGTTFLVAEVRVEHPDTTTTNYAKHHGIWLQGAEKALSMPETLPRLLSGRRRRTLLAWPVRARLPRVGRAQPPPGPTRAGLGPPAGRVPTVPGARSDERGDFWRGFRRKTGSGTEAGHGTAVSRGLTPAGPFRVH